MRPFSKVLSILSLLVITVLFLASCSKTELSSVSVKAEADTYSPIILEFEDKIEASSEPASNKNPNADITDQEVIKSLQSSFSTRKPDFFKYENGLLKAYFNVINIPHQEEKLVIGKNLPIYKYENGKYMLIAVTSNELNLKYVGSKFVLDVLPKPEKEVTKTVEVKYVLTNKDQNYVYKATNAKVVSWEKTEKELSIKYTYGDLKDSLFELYTSDTALENNLLTDVLESNKKVFSKEVKASDRQNHQELENVYLLQGHEDLFTFEYKKGQKNLYVLFASKALSQEENVNIYNWNSEPASVWPGNPMNLLNREKNVFSFLITEPSLEEGKELGFIFNINSEAKLSGDIRFETEELKPIISSEEEILFVFVTSDEKNDTNSTLKVYGMDKLSDFLEYIK